MNNNKLKEFPSIQCISLKESVDRRNKLESWFKKYDISNYNFHIFERIKNFEKYSFGGKFIDRISDGVKPIYISHFNVIRDWYENTDEEYTIIVEDDVSFETVQYWNFTWKEFQDNLPNDCMCVQLVILRYNCEPYEFDRREPYRRGHWSACAYLIKREYAKHLLDSYSPSPNSFTLDIKGVDIVPEIEQILFLDLQKRVYVFPLFVEDCYIESTKFEEEPDGAHKQSSHVCAMNWWKECGRYLPIEKIIK